MGLSSECKLPNWFDCNYRIGMIATTESGGGGITTVTPVTSIAL